MLALWTPRVVLAVGDPSLDWFTFETPHFLVHYPSGMEDTAREAAAVAEEAHAVLSPLLDWAPGAKTHVVLTDFGDGANGYAMVIPYNLVHLFAATPRARSSLNDYDDWLRGLFYHEYVHILHLDTVLGIPALINAVFGKLTAPNGATPRWLTEGLATYYESARSGSGRVRNSIFRMYLRAAALDDTFLSLGALSGAPSGFMGGRGWYLYGSQFWTFMADRFGEAALTEYSHLYGGRLIPYGVNTVARQAFGYDLPSLYEAWSTHVLAEGLGQWVAVRARGGPTPMRRLLPSAFAHDSVRKRPGYPQLAFLHNDGSSERTVALLDLEHDTIEPLYEDHGDGRIAWLPDGGGFVSSQAQVVDRVYSYADLFLHGAGPGGWAHLTDAKGGLDVDGTRRLTFGLRARDPAVSPDGTHVIFVAMGTSRSDLMTVDVQTGDVALVVAGLLGEDFATPTYLPDGRVVVSRFHGPPNGQRDLFLVELADAGQVHWRQLTNDKALDIDPAVDPASPNRVVFSSDRTGVYELYALNITSGETLQLTTSITGTFSPSFDETGEHLYVTVGSGHGYTIAEIITDQLEPTRAQPVVRRTTVVVPAQPRPALEASAYRPWRYLWPQSWLPSFVTSLDFDGTVSLTLSGNDPVGHHAWLAALSHALDDETIGLALAYQYLRLPVDLQLRLTSLEAERGYNAGSQDRPYYEDQLAVGLDIGVPFPGVDDQHHLGATFNLQRYALGAPLSAVHDPIGGRPRRPELGYFNNVRVGWSTSNVDAYSTSISQESGYALSVSTRVRSPLVGADYSSFEVTGGAAGYLPMPWLTNHVLAARVTAGIGWADFRRRGLFIVGGIPEQDVIQSLIDQVGLGGTHLRGYAPVHTFGDRYVLSNVEYRFPLRVLDEGYDTLPFFVGQLHGALFADYGGAWFGDFDAEALALGVGGELRLSTLVGYYLPASLRLGYAYGVHEGGLHHLYLVLGSQF